MADHPDKTVKMIKQAGIIPDAEFFGEMLKSSSLKADASEWNRRLWFNNSTLMLGNAELIFADPDNGISYRKKARTKDSEKFILPEDVAEYYNSERNVVYYCHKGRRKQEAWEQAKAEIRNHIRDAQILKDWIRSLSYEEQKTLLACNDKIARQNAERFAHMDLTKNLTPALLAYDGIQYTYMAPAVFEDGQFDYMQEHLRILSGFYGVVKPLDGVVPYRLEMQAKAAVSGHKNLYDFWDHSLYQEVMDNSRILINLASKEYSKCIEKYLRPEDRYITCVFGELTGGRVVQKGVYAKMARGEMVRFMAGIHAEDPEQIKTFDWSGYHFDEDRSSTDEYVFIRTEIPGKPSRR